MEEYNDQFDNPAGIANLDFNVNDEYKPVPLVPKGRYHGAVAGVKADLDMMAIVWDICLQENGGVLNDGETPIDGTIVQYRSWLPKPGDESVRTKSGNMTKRQWKINALKEFQDELGLDMSTAQIIAQSIAEQIWVGLIMDVDVSISEYQGQFRNQVDRCYQSSI
ncbi:hypothetical protein KO465_04840 [Candidatus Micrarchaeota archaeon]|jgi:hypothetical protein|nr:hypothetical protein [Candidatus Micrarchaeota archaeon]